MINGLGLLFDKLLGECHNGVNMVYFFFPETSFSRES